MVRNLLLLFLILLFPSVMFAQSLQLSATAATANNGPDVFVLDDGSQVKLNSQEIRFLDSGTTAPFSAAGISPDRSIISLLNNTQGEAEITLLNASGDTLNSYTSVSLGSDDPSLAVYPTNAGHLLLRNNIMNFTFHNGLGEIGPNISNGSNSKQGETISQLAVSPDFETVIIYTAKIRANNQVGSKVELVESDKQLQSIFRSDDRYIKDLQLADDGSMISIVTAAEGTNDQVVVIDKYGNEINTINSEEELKEANLSADGIHITLFSNSRVQVYNVLNGEKIGSTSLQQPVYQANYFPEDDMLLILSGFLQTSINSKVPTKS